MNPPDVRAEEQRTPAKRMQNVPLDVTPDAVESFEYYDGYSVATRDRAVYLSVWGFPWWIADPVSAPVSGSFSNDFDESFDGGVGSPTGSSFDASFSSDFS